MVDQLSLFPDDPIVLGPKGDNVCCLSCGLTKNFYGEGLVNFLLYPQCDCRPDLKRRPSFMIRAHFDSLPTIAERLENLLANKTLWRRMIPQMNDRRYLLMMAAILKPNDFTDLVLWIAEKVLHRDSGIAVLTEPASSAAQIAERIPKLKMSINPLRFSEITQVVWIADELIWWTINAARAKVYRIEFDKNWDGSNANFYKVTVDASTTDNRYWHHCFDLTLNALKQYLLECLS